MRTVSPTLMEPESGFSSPMIIGEEKPGSGSIKVGDTVRIAYVDQSRAGLDPKKTLWEVVSDGLDHIKVGNVEMPSRAYVSAFGFKGPDQQKPAGVLSGGERNRLNLALTLKQGGNLLLLDEPTNDLDVDTLRALEEAIVDFAGCAVIISHDRWFLDRVATAILAFEGNGEVTLYEGSYTFYAERRKARTSATASAAADAKQKDTARGARTSQPPRRKLTFKERAELAGIEDAISAAEAKVATLEATLQDPSVFKERGTEVQSLVAELDTARAEVERLFARWQELDAIPKD